MSEAWITQLLKATEASESPRKYWYWSGLAAISAVVNNQVYLDKFLYKLYPNIYVLLVGKSGIRKGPPVAMAKHLVQLVDNTRVIAGRITIQSAITKLKSAVTKPDGKAPITDAIAGLFSSEFASFIVEDPAALTILTDLYDGHYNTTWENSTKGGGDEKLKNPCITLLGASNEVHFRDAVPDNALGGGFVARTFIIHADKKSGVNSLTERPEHIADVNELAKHLFKLSKLKGQFIWSREGKELYDEWYRRFSEGEYSDTTGTIDRLHDHILKAAMLISLSRDVDLHLTLGDIKEAIMACQDFVPGARKVAMTSGGKSSAAPGTAIFIRELLGRKEHKYGMSRIAMGQKHWQYFDMFELDKIAESLKTQKAITEEFIITKDGKKELWWFLEPIIVDRYEKTMSEKG
jgi:hypothetical protein